MISAYIQFNYYTIPLFLGIIVSIIFLAFIAKTKPTLNYRVLIIMSAAAILWLFANAMELLIKTADQKILWNQLTFIGICIVPVSFFVFVMQYCGYRSWSKYQNIIAVSAVPFIYSIMNFTNNYHNLVVKNYSVLNYGLNIYLIKDYGIFFWIWTVYAYILIAISFYQLLKMLSVSIRFYRLITILLILAAIVPIAANLIYLTGLFKTSYIDLTPLTLSLSIIILLVGVIKLDLGNVIPLTKIALLENMKDGVIVIDGHNRILEMNPIAYKITGANINSGIAKNIRSIWPKSEEYMSNADMSNKKIIKLPCDSGINYYEININYNFNHYKQLSCKTIIFRDITEKEKSEKLLRNKVRFAKLIARISASFLSSPPMSINKKIDKALRIIGKFANADRSYIFLITKNRKYFNNTNEWAANGVDAQKDNLQLLPYDEFNWWVEKLKNFGHICYEDINDMPPEADRIADFLKSQDIQSIAAVPMIYKNSLKGFMGFDLVNSKKKWGEEDLSLLRIIGNIFINAIEDYKADRKIKYLSFYDSLTGLYNRAYFEEELKRLNTKRQLPLSIIIGDINGLKIANDAFGHFEGDRLLKTVANVLKNSCREDDIVARWGGDEFAILLPKTTEGQTNEIINRIKASVNKTNNKKVPLSISLGTATKISEGMDILKIMKKAEDMMYRRKLLERKSLFSSFLASLERSLWEKSHETQDHAERLQELAIKLGKSINLSEGLIDDLVILAKLHDIGKIAIPEKILQKKSSLNKSEWEIMKRHSEIGHNIVHASPQLAHIGEAILCHHERWDGTGYPNSLPGEQIPITSRIISIVDAYDVMTNDRPYKRAFSKSEAEKELLQLAGTQFDPLLVNKFLNILDR